MNRWETAIWLMELTSALMFLFPHAATAVLNAKSLSLDV